jgi:hypothetical protein
MASNRKNSVVVFAYFFPLIAAPVLNQHTSDWEDFVGFQWSLREYVSRERVSGTILVLFLLNNGVNGVNGGGERNQE